MPHARKRARSRRLKVKPERVDAAIAEFTSQQLPQFKQQQGYQGFTLLANRENGKLIGISYWESEEHIQASGELGRSASERVSTTGEGESEDPDEWVVVLDEDA